MNLRSLFQQERLLGGAVVLSVTQFGASLAGLVRDRLLNQTFPHLGIVDVYIAAFRPSDLLFQVGIMSAMGTVLVPLLAGYKVKNSKEDMGKLLAGTMGMGSLFYGAIALLFCIFFPWIAPHMVQFQGDELQLYITFGRLAFLTNFLFVFGNAAGQYLVTAQRYWVYGLTPILYTLGTIFGTLVLTHFVGPLGPMLGTLGGAVLYVIWRLLGMARSGIKVRLSLWHPDLHEMGILMLPRMLALGALQLQLLLFDTIASGMDSGSITINANTRNFQSVIVGVVGIAIAQSAFSLLGQTASKGEWKRFQLYIEKGLGMMLLLTIPFSIILVFCAPIAAWLVHLQGPAWIKLFTISLSLYAISVPFESIAHLFLRSFYALKNTTIPAVLGVGSGLAAVFIAWIYAPRLGVYALPLGYTLGQIVETMILGVLLQRKIRGLTKHASFS